MDKFACDAAKVGASQVSDHYAIYCSIQLPTTAARGRGDELAD
jgi:hypothetical protein